MKTKKLWVMTLLLLLSLTLLTACGGKAEIKYAEELAEMSNRLTDTLVPFETIDSENPDSIQSAIWAIDGAIPICEEIIALEAPNSYEEIQELFAKGATCYRDGLQLYKQMLELPINPGAEDEPVDEALEEQYVDLSMAGSDLLMEGADYFQDAFDRLKAELE